MKSKAEAIRNAGTLGYPSKMPGTSYGIPAEKCITGSKLAKIPGSVCHDCYAMKGNYQYRDVKTGQANRFAQLDNPHWTAAMVMLINHAQATGKGRNGKIAKGYHRWHDSGDIQSVNHLEKICEVARRTPKVKHWLPTRELKIVLDYQKQGGVVPDNLVIRVSATMIDGAPSTHWPHTSRVHSDDKLVAPGAVRCPAPDQEGKCGSCRACWSRDVATTSYHKH